MRNLNSRELHGRNLRVDHATRDHGMEKEQPQASVSRSGTVGLGGPVAPPVESIYGPSCNPADAPELISQAINSLPPEQIYKLVKEMKDVIMVCGFLFGSGLLCFRKTQWKRETCFCKTLNLRMDYSKHK